MTPSRTDLAELEQVPNAGPSIAADLRLLGVAKPADLVGRDPYDTFIAAVRFMGGELAKPWWAYTAERNREFADRLRWLESAAH
jgi:hypothetical protein